jgi:chemotaxis protein methyltransferase CheR
MTPEFPFKNPFDFIFCRNVMIYFDPETQSKLASKFYDCLPKDGYLFIGHSETLSRSNTSFKYIQPAVYRK